MNLTAQNHDQALVIVVEEDRIDAACAIQFKDKVRELADGVESRIVMDLARVGFLDSSGLGAVVSVLKFLGPKGKLELAGLTPAVAKVFRLTRMDSVFTIHDSVAAALGGNATAA